MRPILADLVKNVGGNRVNVATLVGPDSDAHVYSPAPADAKKIADVLLVMKVEVLGARPPNGSDPRKRLVDRVRKLVRRKRRRGK